MENQQNFISSFEEVVSELQSACDNLRRNQSYLNIFYSKDINANPSEAETIIMKLFMDKAWAYLGPFNYNAYMKYYFEEAIKLHPFDLKTDGKLSTEEKEDEEEWVTDNEEIATDTCIPSKQEKDHKEEDTIGNKLI